MFWGGPFMNEWEKKRERLYREEQKNNPAGHFNDTFNRAQSGMPNTSGMSWKELGALILFFIIIFIGYSLYKFFKG